jgi:hypothetical protein
VLGRYVILLITAGLNLKYFFNQRTTSSGFLNISESENHRSYFRQRITIKELKKTGGFGRIGGNKGG